MNVLPYGPRDWLVLLGKIISMSIARGFIARFMTHSLYSSLNSRESWHSYIPISSEARSELQFWLENIEKYNGQNLWPSPSAVRVVYSDASAIDVGSFTVDMALILLMGNGPNKRPYRVQPGGS